MNRLSQDSIARRPLVSGVAPGMHNSLKLDLSITQLKDLLGTAGVIAAVGFVEASAVGKKFGHKHGYEVSANRSSQSDVTRPNLHD